MQKSILDLYARDESFIDFLAHDLDDNAVWFNNSEFARYHNIDGNKILSIFTADTKKSFNINIGGDKRPEGISKNGGVLYCRKQEIIGVNPDQPLKLDGKLYTISEAKLLQDQIWRIVLEANT